MTEPTQASPDHEANGQPWAHTLAQLQHWMGQSSTSGTASPMRAPEPFSALSAQPKASDCQACRAKTSVESTRSAEGVTWRRRKCKACGHAHVTQARAATEQTVPGSIPRWVENLAHA